jgi:AcrR family transcriptional regulator
MTRSNPDARQRLVLATADMLRRRGLNATSVRDVAKHAQAPLGSTYHYFPGGKPQMVTEAVHLASEKVVRGLAKALEDGPVKGVRAFLGLWREIIVSTDFRAGCPVLAVTMEEPASEDDAVALSAAAEAFAAWEALLADSLRRHGASAKQARQLATLTVAAIEGAIAMCRAERSVRAFDHVSSQLESLVVEATGA